MKRILLAFPSMWDLRQLEASRAAWGDRYEIVLAEPFDAECPYELDPSAWVETMIETHGGSIDGVFTSTDYPGSTLAAVVAQRLGLRGPAPDRILRTLHKFHCREVLERAVPEANPPFWLIDPQGSAASFATPRYPVFLKPVRGTFSLHAKRIANRAEMIAFLRRPAIQLFLEEYLAIFHRSVRAFSRLDLDGRYFLAEGVLTGCQVTVEGFVQGGRVEAPWVTDSVFHPGTNSFRRFDHPSVLPGHVQDRMRGVAVRALEALGLDDTLFNVEMMHDPVRDTDHIIEINPRMCGQFADFYRKVHGVDGYEVALALAAGDPVPERARVPGGGRWPCASSNPLRIFEPSRFERVPPPEVIRAAEASHDGCLIWNEASTGQVMDDFTSGEDGASARYAIINLGARDAADRETRLTDILDRLDFGISPLGAAPRAAGVRS